MSVTVVGAGIIGVTSALKLLELGRRVQLLERRSMAALETSYHNGCVFTPYFYSPLVSKVERLVDQQRNMGLFFKSLFQSGGSYRLDLSIVQEKNFFRFLANMLLLSMRDTDLHRNQQRLLDIGEVTHAEYTRLRQQHPDLFRCQTTKGLAELAFFPTRAALDTFKAVFDTRHVHTEIIENLAQLGRFDPRLVNDYNQQILTQLGNCLLLPQESSLDTGRFTRDAVEYMKQRYPDRFEFRVNCDASRWTVRDGRVVALESNQGSHLSDNYVIATALHARHLDQLRVKIPLLPVKGWAAAIPFDQLKGPKEGINLVQHFNFFNGHQFCVPIEGQVRTAGIAHIISDGGNIDDWGARQLVRQFNDITGESVHADGLTMTQCYRPISPDDGAMIGLLPGLKNVYMNNGHGSKGTSHSFGAANILTDVMHDPRKWAQFSLNRFYFIK